MESINSVENYNNEDIEYFKKHGCDRQGRLVDVYTVDFDTVEEKFKLSKVEKLVKTIRKKYFSLPGGNDDKKRNIIKKSSFEIKTFAETTHPQLFLTITDKKTNDKVMKAVTFLISQKKDVKKGKKTNYEASKECQEYCLEEFKKD